MNKKELNRVVSAIERISKAEAKMQKEQKHLLTLYHMDSDGRKSLCSGYGVYPDGEKCSGCSDCTKRRGYKFYGKKGSGVNIGRVRIAS